jgi:hypothetical protein
MRVQKTGTDLSCQVDIGRIDVRLCGPNGTVVLLCEGQLAKLREELIEAISRGTACGEVISTPNGRPDAA